MLLAQLRTQADDAKAKQLLGIKHSAEDYNLLVTGSATLYKPNGDRLLTVLREAISEEAKETSREFLHAAASYQTMNRGNYSGTERKRWKKQDGTLSNTTQGEQVRSAIAGSFDRNPRFPFCRQTKVTTQHAERWGACRQLLQEVARHFEREVPKRYAAQLVVAKKTHPAYVIPETPFTTVTINNTFAGGYHTDRGDYAPGFGCMTVFRRGTYRGCELVFPKYGVAVDMRDRDLILFDPHEIHGNVPFFDTVGEERKDLARVSVVYYFREKMTECRSPAEELEQARKIRGGDLSAAFDNE